jgi:biotin carboxylase
MDQNVETAFIEALSYSRGKEILVEEYIEGLEFGAQTFSVDGECKVVLLHNDILSPPPHMIPVGHSFPFKYLNKTERDLAVSDIQKAVLALGIKNGPSNVDLILDKKDNRIKIIEIGARIGATCLPELVQYYTGIDWVAASIKSAMGEVPDLEINKEQAVAAFILESPKDGKLVSFEIPESDLPGLLELEITATQGEVVSRLRKGTDRIGKVICKGVSADDAENRVLTTLQRFNFVIDG